MIGVIGNPSESTVIREFFELFKTPWEFCRSGRPYEVLLCVGEGSIEETAAKLVLVYSGKRLAFDEARKIEIASHGRTRILLWETNRIPIYGDSVTFQEKGSGLLRDEESQQSAMYFAQSDRTTVVRIGYDLFEEVRILLTTGQPAIHGGIPALDLHIAFLRDLIVSNGVSLCEIPPAPEGYRFIACLTHDIDHPALRKHKFDHTAFGFFYRAIFGSLLDLFRGRMSMRGLLVNWTAALKFPLVQLGLAKDFWYEFDDYTRIEKGARSSFFAIPFKGYPGRKAQDNAPGRRASGYAAAEIAPKLQELKAAGCEIGLHGLDAWLDADSGSKELEEIRGITGARQIGARMHWLYFDEHSPAMLEKAGVDYDSSVGYNQTIGFRSGTSQAYKPFETERLLELPMHIMDTALFYRAYLDLPACEARRRISAIVDHAAQSGGAITINWHDRSIAPERLWGGFYAQLVDELKDKGAWFATASEAVAWFRKRRSTTFENGSTQAGASLLKTVGESAGSPNLLLRVYEPGKTAQDVPVRVMALDRVPAALGTE